MNRTRTDKSRRITRDVNCPRQPPRFPPAREESPKRAKEQKGEDGLGRTPRSLSWEGYFLTGGAGALAAS
jgi:hypothetical protein